MTAGCLASLASDGPVTTGERRESPGWSGSRRCAPSRVRHWSHRPGSKTLVPLLLWSPGSFLTLLSTAVSQESSKMQLVIDSSLYNPFLTCLHWLRAREWAWAVTRGDWVTWSRAGPGWPAAMCWPSSPARASRQVCQECYSLLTHFTSHLTPDMTPWHRDTVLPLSISLPSSCLLRHWPRTGRAGLSLSEPELGASRGYKAGAGDNQPVQWPAMSDFTFHFSFPARISWQPIPVMSGLIGMSISTFYVS